jgi:NADH-quinone oxidoreductase subunit N
MKRMLAYSSISHAGYMLMTISANQSSTTSTILYYSLAYTLATVTAFAIFKIVSEYQTGRVEKPENFQAFEGLAKQNPLLAFCLTISLLSLAGIPLTAGFWGKFFVFADTFHRNITYSIIVAVLMSAVGIYYYFKGIIAAYFKTSEMEVIYIPGLYQVALIMSTLATLILGIYPTIVKSLF